MNGNSFKDNEYNQIMNCIRDKEFDFGLIRDVLPQAFVMLDDPVCDRHKLKNMLQNIGHSIFCKSFDFPRNDVRHDLYFPGSHDYNVALARHLEEARPFYIKWLHAMEPYLASDGNVYPRYIPVMDINESCDRHCFVSEAVLLTKEDVPELENCILPRYYIIPDDYVRYGTLEEQEMKFSKYMGSSWKDVFRRFREKEWPVCHELETNIGRYRNLSKTVRLS